MSPFADLDVKMVDGLPVCQRPNDNDDACDVCYGLASDADDTPICLEAVRRFGAVAMGDQVSGKAGEVPV